MPVHGFQETGATAGKGTAVVAGAVGAGAVTVVAVPVGPVVVVAAVVWCEEVQEVATAKAAVRRMARRR
jgi:Flp pilus assembly CpaF family ATPase